jgi:hypothetical protein
LEWSAIGTQRPKRCRAVGRQTDLGSAYPFPFERRALERAAPLGALHRAAGLGVVKAKPSRTRKVRDLDRPCARRRVDCAGRDGRKDGLRRGPNKRIWGKVKKEQEKKDAMTSDDAV